MKKTQWTDLFREIKKNLGRYISLMFIVALGTAFFAGVRSAEPDMIASADKYYDESNLMDVRVIGTLGLTADDVEAIEKTEGIEHAEGGYSIEAMAILEDSELVVNVMSPSKELNQMTIWQGRMPEAENECFMDEGFMIGKGYEIGDTITLESEEGGKPENLKYSTYTIVGSGTWSWYLSWTRGSASIGDGSLDAFMVVPESAFEVDYYTVIYALVHGAQNLNTFSDNYDEAVALVTERIEEIAGERCEIRYSEVYEDAEKAIDDAKQEVSNGVKELQDAEQKLLDGEQAYEDGKKAYDEGVKALEDGKIALEQGKADLEAGRIMLEENKKTYEDGVKAVEEAEAELKSGQQELALKETELEQSEQQIAEGKAALEAGKKEITQAESELQAAKKELETAEKAYEKELDNYTQQKAKQDELAAQIEASEEKIATLEAQIADLDDQIESGGTGSNYMELIQQRNEYNTQLEEEKAVLEQTQAKYDEYDVQLKAAKSELDAAKSEIDTQRTQLNEAESQMNAKKAELSKQEAQLTAGEQQVKEGRLALEQAKKEMSAAEATIASKKAELEYAKTELEKGETEYQNGLAALVASEEELKQAEQDLKEGGKELLNSRQELEEGWQEYKEAAQEANEKLDEARQKIADGEEELIELEAGKWYVLGRDTVQNSVEYGMDAERIGAIGKVFPIIFFLVAALVSLTTMTRMIEEERTLIGTMKALGYSKFAIAAKYIVYAASATLVGGILGVIGGSKLLPFVIMQAYGMLYSNVQYMLIPLHAELCITSIGLALLCTVGATIMACYKELLSTPAALMRPPAPKQGKRVLLERIPFIWSNLNFSMKSTIRNLVRYKKRLFMTVFGIGGCMAILIVSFGLGDSIAVVTNKQYKTIWTYSVSCSIEEDTYSDELANEVDMIVNGDSNLKNALLNRQMSVDVSTDLAEKNANLFIPEDLELIGEYVNLRERVSEEGHKLNDDGVILSEKLAASLGVVPGDTFSIQFEETDVKEVKVTAIVENYLNHYIYMTPALYEELQGEPVEYNQIFLKYKENISAEEESRIAEYLLEQEMVKSVLLVSELQASVDDMMNALNLVVWVLIVAAGLLVFVVLFNLNNINISERRRELASLKVLGFYDMEVAMYVYRENIFLTLFGIIAGIFMGTWLHQYLILTLEVEMLMFGRNIFLASYVYSVLLTILFAFLVNITMFYKLKQIDMIESLKSVE